jgi:hypothetical protein
MTHMQNDSIVDRLGRHAQFWSLQTHAKVPGFVQMLCSAQNLSVACCATLYTYIDAILITKPHAYAFCMRFAEARHLHLVMVRGDRDTMQTSQGQTQQANLACCDTLNRYNNAI